MAALVAPVAFARKGILGADLAGLRVLSRSKLRVALPALRVVASASSSSSDGADAQTGAMREAGQSDIDPNRRYEEMMRRRKERREQTMQEYGELKRKLSQLTLGVGGAGALYCLLGISIQSGISYSVGSAASCVYLLLLFNHADTITQEDLPQSFLIDRNKPKRPGLVNALSSVDSPLKVLEGARLAMSSQRLLVPAALIGMWAVSSNTWDGSETSFHLQFGPLFLGFLSYKFAILLFTFQDVTE